ncbi:MAG TPA: SBBP repeat-containing protein [Allocoleopsis sp.]
MTSTLITLVIIFGSTIGYAQGSDFLWAQQIGGDGNQIARGVAADKSDRFGNVTVTGSFNERAVFDNQTLTSAGQEDIFITKYNGQGKVLWLKQFGSRGKDFAFDIVSDDRGNSLVTGLFTRSVDFGSFTLSSQGRGDMFTAKLDPSGNVIWAKQIGSPELDGGNEIVSDPSNNVLVIANTYGTLSIGDSVFQHQGDMDTFITKYDSNGNLRWARQIAGPLAEQGRGIATDLKSNVLVTGEFAGSLSFGSKAVESKSELRDIFLAKYDASGNLLWAKSFGSTGEDYGRGIGADAAGNIYFTGVFSGSVKFDDQTLNSIEGSKDLFLAKADASGKILWVRQMGGPGPDEGCEIEVDEQGNAYLSGEFPNKATFGAQVFTSKGLRDMFVAKFDSQGNLVWSKQAGGDRDDVNYAIAVDDAHRVTVVGTFTSQATFGNFALRRTNNVVNSFVARLGTKQS